MKTSWQTKMILVLLAWCLILALWNAVQSMQIQSLRQSQLITQQLLISTEAALLSTQQTLGWLQTNVYERLDRQLKAAP